MKKIAFLSIWLVAAAVAGFNFGNIDLSKAVKDTGKILHSTTGIGEQEEASIGNSVALEIISKYGGLVRDETITRRVNLIGKSVAYYSARPELNYRFGILNSGTVNAFSTPGGNVFLTKGLYDLIQNDDELAGVLAHEIMHVTEKHALKIIERGEFLDGVAGWAGQAGSATGKADLTRFAPGVNKITRTVCETGFDPKTEFAADKGGAQLAAMAGYAPGGLEQCLKTLAQHQTGSVSFFPTHPPLKARIEKLDAQAAHHGSETEN